MHLEQGFVDFSGKDQIVTILDFENVTDPVIRTYICSVAQTDIVHRQMDRNVCQKTKLPKTASTKKDSKLDLAPI